MSTIVSTRALLAGVAATGLLLTDVAVASDSKTRIVSDAAGDANGTSALTTSPSTAPASVASADLRHVDLVRTKDGLQLRFGLTELPDISGDAVQTFYRLSGVVGSCSFHLGVLIGSLTPGQAPASGLQPFFDPVSGCPNGTEIIQADPSWSGSVDAGARELVADFPLATLPARIPGVAPGARITDVSADSSVGTYAFAAGSVNAERYTSVVLDAAPGGLDYVIPCTEQEC